MRTCVVAVLMVGLGPAVSMAELGGSLEDEQHFFASSLETVIDSAPRERTNQTTVDFKFSSSVPNATFKCTIDTDGPFGCVSPFRESALAAGVHKFCVFAVDGTGQKDETPACHSWTVDLIAPTVAISAPTSGEVVPTSDPSIKGTTNEPSSTINVFIDDSAQSAGSVVADATTGSWTFSKPLGLNDGEHTVSATATDPAGNVGARSAKVSFRVNANIADTSIVEHPQQVHHSRHAVFEFASSTGATRFECQLDNAAAGFTECEQVTLFKNLSDGSHTLKVRAKDSAGNVDPTPAEFTWTVDTQSPPGTCTPGDSGGEPQGGCASSGGQPTLVLSLLGGLLLVLTARRRRSS